MSQGATISIMMIMIIVVVGLGIYLMNAGTCSGPDSNASYKYNDEGECVIDKCNAGYVLEGNVCITDSCSGPDLNASYKYNDDGECVIDKCNAGYALEGGYCIKQIDHTANMQAGKIPVNCEIGGYIEGPCVNGVGRQLTGEPGRCGTGVKRFTADPSAFTMANSLGECENYSYTEACEVECREVGCSAKEENYTKTDGVCRGLDGNPIGGDTNLCGTGYQIYEVDPATAGYFDTDELRDNWVAENWKDCTPLKKSCDVICEPGMNSSGCPELSEDAETSYVLGGNQEPACFPKEYAVALLKGDTVYDSFKAYEPLTRETARQAGITSMNKLPQGYFIRYKSGMADFKEYTIKGCTRAQLEPCVQPTISQDCKTREDMVQACYDVGCGQQKKKKINVVIDEEAWGLGSCDRSKLGEYVVNCSEAKTLDCCSSENEMHWKTSTGKCSVNGERLMEQDNCSMLGLDTVPTKYEECCYKTEWPKEFSSARCNLDERNGFEKQTRTVINCGTEPGYQYVPNYDCGMIHGVRSMVVKGMGEQGGGGMIVTLKSGDQEEVYAYSGETDTHTFQSDVIVKAISGNVQAGGTDAWAEMYLYDSAGKKLFSTSAGVNTYKPRATLNIKNPAYETPDWVIPRK